MSKVVDPNCTEKGYTQYTCSVCGKTWKENFKDATGHKYVDKIIPPTSSDKGYTLHTCSVCGHSYKDNYTNQVPEKPKVKVSLNGDTVTISWNTCKLADCNRFYVNRL